MNFEEHAGKQVLASAGIAVPDGGVATDVDAAIAVAARLRGKSGKAGVIIKAQATTGKRGKAGGIRPAKDDDEIRAVCDDIIGMKIGEHTIERVLVEGLADIKREFYAAVMNDPVSKGPKIMFSAQGGMDIEEIAATSPQSLMSADIDIDKGYSLAEAQSLLAPVALGASAGDVADVLVKLYSAWRQNDAELVEINPLAELADGAIVALDCKLTIDDSSVVRREQLAQQGVQEKLTSLEQQARDLDLKFIQLDGNIGVLANGAGLTMTTMDVIAHHGGRPANFLEIGGEAYTRATPALKLVLDNEGVSALVVNFCGAFARTDVMTEGVIKAWQELKPEIPVFFSIHGTGSIEAREMLRERLSMQPYDTMDDAIVAAIKAADDAASGAADGAATAPPGTRT